MKRVISRYFILLKEFYRASVMAEMESRANLVMKVATDLIWYSTQFVLFETLFRQVNNLSGWTLEASRVFLGVFLLVDAIYMILFSSNMDGFSSQVARGDLDLVLVKPVNAQFMVSTRRMNSSHLFNVTLVAGWLIYSFSCLPSPEWWRLLYLVPLVPCAVAVYYSLRFMIVLLSIIFTRAENINYLWYQLLKIAGRPDSFYPRWIRYILLTVIPVGFLASVPSRLILNLGTPERLLTLLFAGLAVAGLFLFLSSWLWRHTLRLYSSASS